MIDKVLVFSGTSEGRKLSELLANSGIETVVCVATEYGAEMMTDMPFLEIHKGRLGIDEMSKLMKDGFAAVVDATHPFAVTVSQNIREAVRKSGLCYLRLRRDTSDNACDDVRRFESHDECAEALLNTEGNILLTTGSKNLKAYCTDEGIRERLYVRVLPNSESIEACRECGIKRSRIIAMQGPFSEEMNLAMLRQLDISIMVTKESGDAGGFEQKYSATKKHGAELYVISNPEQTEGIYFDEVCKRLEEITGCVISNDGRGLNDFVTDGVPKTGRLHIVLTGAGPGGEEMMTIMGKEYLEKADYVFGAKRLVESVAKTGILKSDAECLPFYRAEDIIPVLENINIPKCLAVILYSGDTGFYSGASSAYEELVKWRGERHDVAIDLLPGISSVSYLAARLRMNLQDAAVVSVHGKGDSSSWKGGIEYNIRHNRTVFILVSGCEDVRSIGIILDEAGLNKCGVIAGSNLSGKDEKIICMTLDECREYDTAGPVTLVVINDEPEPLYVVPHFCDDDFIRGNVPMTKEEIRDIVLCKLCLTDDAVVYDIGSGTGSVACAIAERSGGIRVHAIEMSKEGAELTRSNSEKIAPGRVDVIRGMAPEAFSSLPVPSHAFIGGSAGRLSEIISALYKKNPMMRIVMTAVTLETIGEMNDILGQIPVENSEIIQLQVSRVKKAGTYNMMNAENPVFICSFDFVGCEKKGNVDGQ